LSARQDLIAWSLERLSERAGDPTDEVYRRLFTAHPELEPMFVLDTQGAVRGAMLTKAFEALLDMAGEDRFGRAFIHAEGVNHDGIGVSRAMFLVFFSVVLDVTRDLVGEDWTPEVESAWRTQLGRVEAAVEVSG